MAGACADELRRPDVKEMHEIHLGLGCETYLGAISNLDTDYPSVTHRSAPAYTPSRSARGPAAACWPLANGNSLATRCSVYPRLCPLFASAYPSGHSHLVRPAPCDHPGAGGLSDTHPVVPVWTPSRSDPDPIRLLISDPGATDTPRAKILTPLTLESRLHSSSSSPSQELLPVPSLAPPSPWRHQDRPVALAPARSPRNIAGCDVVSALSQVPYPPDPARTSP